MRRVAVAAVVAAVAAAVAAGIAAGIAAGGVTVFAVTIVPATAIAFIVLAVEAAATVKQTDNIRGKNNIRIFNLSFPGDRDYSFEDENSVVTESYRKTSDEFNHHPSSNGKLVAPMTEPTRRRTTVAMSSTGTGAKAANGGVISKTGRPRVRKIFICILFLYIILFL